MMNIWMIRETAKLDLRKSAATENWHATMLADPANVSTIHHYWIKKVFGNDW
jgi:hypothetical protein